MENIWTVVLPILLFVLISFYFFTQVINNKKLNSNVENSNSILPLRIQAYERMTLFLERLKPENMVLRLDNQLVEVKELQSNMLKEIREEFNHNAAQQIYISSGSWTKIQDAVKYTQILIQQSGSNLTENATSKEYIYNLLNHYDNLAINEALNSLKSEVQKLF